MIALALRDIARMAWRRLDGTVAALTLIGFAFLKTIIPSRKATKE